MLYSNLLLSAILTGILTFCSIFNPTVFAQEHHVETALHTGWKFRQAGSEKWIEARIPGSTQFNLLKNSLIEDPFYRDQERHLEWTETADWEYQLLFEPAKNFLQHDIIELEFQGIDTYADIYLNGQLIKKTDNYFRTWNASVKELLVSGQNELLVYIHSAGKMAKPKWEALGYELPGGIRTVTRKPGFHFGWDWGPTMITSGIWQPVILRAWSNLKIRSVFYQQQMVTRSEAKLEVILEIESLKKEKVQVEIGHNRTLSSGKHKLKKGFNQIRIPIQMEDPQLWWTNGLGEAHLYEMEAKLSLKGQQVDQHKVRIGLRSLELVQEKDKHGKSFYFRLNGVPVFMKGANYIPQDNMQDRVTDQHYERIINNALDANMNMLRVWGGGIYEKDLFYQLCDENGILVWQDFMFACAMYPGDQAFLNSVEKEVKDQIRRLRNHPSIALWCGNNENAEGWARWGWQDQFTGPQKWKIKENYDKVFLQILPNSVRKLSPGTPYWESSPSLGRGDPRHQFEGDSHYWGVWHDAEPFEMFEKKVPRFMSEFGFQSFPEMRSIKKFASEEDYFLESEIMGIHQKHPRGNQLITAYMERDFIIPENFPDFVYTSQLLQAEGMRIGIEAQRRAMPYCMGSLYWQLNDCWPVASWSGIDYYGNRKALHYYVKKAFDPLLLSVERQNDSIRIFAVSDHLDKLEADLVIRCNNFLGKTLNSKRKTVSIHGNTSTLLWEGALNELMFRELNKGEQLLEILLEEPQVQDRASVGDGYFARTLHYLVPSKDLELPDPVIKITNAEDKSGNAIWIESEAFAKGVYIEFDAEGNFSDNYFDLLPGERKKVFFESSGKISDFPKEIRVRSLFDTGLY